MKSTKIDKLDILIFIVPILMIILLIVAATQFTDKNYEKVELNNNGKVQTIYIRKELK